MLTKSCYQTRVWLLFLCLLFVFMVSCESKDKYAGVYKAAAADSPRQAETAIELKANGEGFWRVGGEEISFSWYIKRGELRVNTKGGGVIVGKIEKDTIEITLPNLKTMSFKKIQ